MGESSVLWLRVAAGLYSFGLLDAIITVIRRREALFRVALTAFALGALFQLVSLVELGMVQHQLPVSDIFETMSFCSWIITAAFLAIYYRYKAASLSVFIFPLVFVMTLIGALRTPVSTWSSPVIANTWLAVHVVAILLGIIFLAAQMHCCVDINSGVMSSHICPICSAAGSAVATPAVTMTMVPAVNRLEVVGIATAVPVVELRNVSSRAPPLS